MRGVFDCRVRRTLWDAEAHSGEHGQSMEELLWTLFQDSVYLLRLFLWLGLSFDDILVF